MTYLGATQVVSFPGGSPVAVDFAAVDSRRDQRSLDSEVRAAIDSLRARCRAAEDAAAAAAAAESRAHAELSRMRQLCQERLEATALEVLELKRELLARERMAMEHPSASSQSPTLHTDDDEIPFDRIEAVLAASPL